jgi:hypothetical protein
MYVWVRSKRKLIGKEIHWIRRENPHAAQMQLNISRDKPATCPGNK